MTTVKSTTVPLHSRLATRSADAYFADAYELALSRPPSCALAVYLHAVGQTPAWVERLMAIRNRVVGTLGLKNLGAMGAVDASKPLDATTRSRLHKPPWGNTVIMRGAFGIEGDLSTRIDLEIRGADEFRTIKNIHLHILVHKFLYLKPAYFTA